MKTIRAALILSAVVLAACLDLTGFQQVVDQTLLQGVVARVVCPDTVQVGEVGQCQAFNTRGTVISGAEGGPLPGDGWDAEPDSVLAIDFLGSIEGLIPGEAVVIGYGVQNSQAGALVTVVAPGG